MKTRRFTLQNVSLWVMSIAYLLAGLGHFLNPQMYMAMMPPILPFPLALIYVSGAAEMGLALGLIFQKIWTLFSRTGWPASWPNVKRLAAWGIIALLIAVFPANVYMYLTGGVGYDFPHWALLARLPLQLVLIWWAYSHTRKCTP